MTASILVGAFASCLESTLSFKEILFSDHSRATSCFAIAQYARRNFWISIHPRQENWKKIFFSETQRKTCWFSGYSCADWGL